MSQVEQEEKDASTTTLDKDTITFSKDETCKELGKETDPCSKEE